MNDCELNEDIHQYPICSRTIQLDLPELVKKSASNKNKIVIYTCIVGKYDLLKEVANPESNIDYICFSDTTVHSNTWKVLRIPPVITLLSPAKIARCIKILPHLFLSEYETSIWVDGSIEVLGSINEFLYKNSNKQFSLSKHPHRNCVYDEAIAVLKRGKDIPEVVIPQIVKYSREGYPKNYGLVQTGIIIRRHNEDECIKICENWWKEVSNGSKRDQLSFNYSIWNKFISVNLLDPSIFCSQYFQLWTHDSNKKSEKIIPPNNDKFINNFINGVPI